MVYCIALCYAVLCSAVDHIHCGSVSADSEPAFQLNAVTIVIGAAPLRSFCIHIHWLPCYVVNGFAIIYLVGKFDQMEYSFGFHDYSLIPN